jgi:hypothetical protein
LFCDWFNPLSHHGWVEVYMFIVVTFYNRYSTILSTMSNMHALPFNGCDQCSLLVWYNTLSHFCWTSSQMKNKIYLLSSTHPKKVSNLYSIWTSQLKMWQGKAWVCLSYTIHTGNRSRAVTPGGVYHPPPPKKSKKGGPACEEAALESGSTKY